VKKIHLASLAFYLSPTIGLVLGGVIGFQKGGWWTLPGAAAGLVSAYILIYIVFFIVSKRRLRRNRRLRDG
jgi:hypothetical protein